MAGSHSYQHYRPITKLVWLGLCTCRHHFPGFYLRVPALLQTPFALTGKGENALRPLLSCLEIRMYGQVKIGNVTFFVGSNISRRSKDDASTLIPGPSDLFGC